MSGEAEIRAAFAQRIDCYDAPSPIDWQNAGLAPDDALEQRTGKDEIALARWLDPATVNGQPAVVLNVLRVPVSALVTHLGALFAAGRPTAAAFTAACNAIPLAQPPGWPPTEDGIDGKGRPFFWPALAVWPPVPVWPPPTWCRGFCRYAAKFKSEGILA